MIPCGYVLRDKIRLLIWVVIFLNLKQMDEPDWESSYVNYSQLPLLDMRLYSSHENPGQRHFKTSKIRQALFLLLLTDKTVSFILQEKLCFLLPFIFFFPAEKYLKLALSVTTYPVAYSGFEFSGTCADS